MTHTKHSFSVAALASILVILLAILSLIPTPKTIAQSSIPACPPGTQLYGWAWSSNIGWISFNSQNAGGEGGTHCVSIDASDNVIGWAWSSNIGWIKFGGLSGFPASGSALGNAKKTSTEFTGWARACGGTITGDCNSMSPRTDGWDGWIELSGTNHSVAYNGGAGTVTGYAWGSDVVGWTQFNLSTTAGPASGASCALSGTPVAGVPGKHRLTWSSVEMVSCSGAGLGFDPKTLSGTADVTPASSTVYSLSCRPASNPATSTLCPSSYSVNVDVSTPSCASTGTCPSVQMWLNNDPAETQSFMRIRPGDAAEINWKKGDDTIFAGCYARVDTNLLDSSQGFDTTQHRNGSPYTVPSSYLPVGDHDFLMSCTTDTDVVVQGRTLDNKTKLQIRVVDPKIEEI